MRLANSQKLTAKSLKTQRMKTLKLITLISLAALMMSCGSKQKETPKEVVYPVDAKAVTSTEKTKELEYFGIISSRIINYSFVMSGKVETIYVNKNQHVKKGTKLIRLETSGLKLALNAAKHQLSQAKNAFEESDRYYKNLKKAFESGGISGSDLDKANLDRNVKEQDYQQAKINLKAKQDDLNHATLVAASDGVVSDIVPKKGEIVEAGAETIIIQGTGFFAETSISQKDMDKISVGAKAIVEYRNQKLEGSVTYISSLPDFQTFRHTVKIIFSGNDSNVPATIGQTVKVFIKAGSVSGMWITVKLVYNDGEDYVNVIENDRLRKKRIQIIDYSGDNVRVEGLVENEMIITKGAGNISEGYKVKVEAPSNSPKGGE